MTDEEFFDICYDQYKSELEHCEAIYQRAGFVLTAESIVAGAVIALGSAEPFGKCFTTIEVCSYYLFASLSLLLVMVSVICLFFAVCPRKYSALAPLREWQRRRKELLSSQGPAGTNSGKSQFVEEITTRVCESDATSKHTNEKRRQTFKISLLTVGLAMLFMCLEAVCRFVLQVEGLVK